MLLGHSCVGASLVQVWLNTPMPRRILCWIRPPCLNVGLVLICRFRYPWIHDHASNYYTDFRIVWDGSMYLRLPYTASLFISSATLVSALFFSLILWSFAFLPTLLRNTPTCRDSFENTGPKFSQFIPQHWTAHLTLMLHGWWPLFVALVPIQMKMGYCGCNVIVRRRGDK